MRTRPQCFVNRLAHGYLEVTSQNVVSRTTQTHIFTLDYEHSSSPFTEYNICIAVHELIAQEEKRLRRLNSRTNCVKSSKKAVQQERARIESVIASQPQILPCTGRASPPEVFAFIFDHYGNHKQLMLPSSASARAGIRQRVYWTLINARRPYILLGLSGVVGFH